MSGPKRQSEAHKSYLVTPIEYAKGFVYFCHIADLESSSQDGSQPGCEDDLGAKQMGEVDRLGSQARVFVFLFGPADVLNVCSGDRCYAGRRDSKCLKRNGYLLLGD